MRITSIQFENFKNLKSCKYSFGDSNILKGKNGAGKSSIRDAVLFVLYNITSDGGKNTEKYISEGESFCKVEIETDNGTFTRAKTFTSTDLLHNGLSITQKDLDIPPVDVFCSVFNVGYFSSLSDKEKRNLILNTEDRMLPIELYLEANGKEEWLKKYKIELSDVEDAIKLINKLKKTCELEIVKAEAILEFIDKYGNDCFTSDTVRTEFIVENTKTIEINKINVKELELCKKAVEQIEPLEIKKKSKDLVDALQNEFGDVDLILTEAYKSKADIKDIFQFTVNGLKYNQLSTGERLRFDIIVSQFFNSLLKNPVDMYFIDETSVLDQNPDYITNSQMFYTIVMPDQELDIISQNSDA